MMLSMMMLLTISSCDGFCDYIKPVIVKGCEHLLLHNAYDPIILIIVSDLSLVTLFQFLCDSFRDRLDR